MVQTKYNIDYPSEVLQKTFQRLSNQLWKCIPMRENEEDWQKQLNTNMIEIAGLAELLMSPQFLQIQSKVEGLLKVDTEFDLYRKTIFECLSLIQELNHGR